MNIIEMARNLGTEIQKTEEYQTLVKAKAANDAATELQKQIGQFHLVKLQIQAASSAQKPNQEEINRKNEELQQLYQAIMQNQNMQAFEQASEEINTMLNQIKQILSVAVNGGDPQTCSTEQEQNCTGSCESCSGCH